MLLIIRYDCFVANEPTNSVDYQVRHYDISANETIDLEEMLRAEETNKYLNGTNEEVQWRFTEIVAVDWEPELKHGKEVIGFITGKPQPTE